MKTNLPRVPILMTGVSTSAVTRRAPRSRTFRLTPRATKGNDALKPENRARMILLFGREAVARGRAAAIDIFSMIFDVHCLFARDDRRNVKEIPRAEMIWKSEVGDRILILEKQIAW